MQGGIFVLDVLAIPPASRSSKGWTFEKGMPFVILNVFYLLSLHYDWYKIQDILILNLKKIKISSKYANFTDANNLPCSFVDDKFCSTPWIPIFWRWFWCGTWIYSSVSNWAGVCFTWKNNNFRGHSRDRLVEWGQYTILLVMLNTCTHTFFLVMQQKDMHTLSTWRNKIMCKAFVTCLSFDVIW